ncbi:unnamed protein product, partial [Acidithrix sp. C25]
VRFLSRQEFLDRAAQSMIVPVYREILADELTPVSVYRALASGESHSFLLESVERGERWSRYSFIGIRPLGVLSLTDSKVSFVTQDHELARSLAIDPDGSYLDQFDRLLGELATEPMAELPPLQSGFVGFVGYDVISEVEDIGARNPDPVGFPDAICALIGDLACFDHLAQRVFLISTVVVPGDSGGGVHSRLYDEANDRLDELERRVSNISVSPFVAPISQSGIVLSNLEVSISQHSFVESIEIAKEHILDGDIFQVVLSKRFSFDLECDPLSFYRVLRLKNPSPYMYFVDFPEIKIAGSSPEPLVRVEGQKVISRPIAGTRSRGTTQAEDLLLAAELIEHPKELAEHTMLVDLARNDLGRISQYGSEHIDELMTLERYSRVMHLTSQVSAKRREGVTIIDVLKATMPAGTVSGAPKVRAMQIINELESYKRGPYAGVVGYFDLAGNMDVAISIRTLLVEPSGRGHLQAGAGIVFDSDPIGEDEECNNKAKALLEAASIAAMTGKFQRNRD